MSPRVLSLGLVLFLGCREAPAVALRPPGERKGETPELTEVAWEGGLEGDWEDHGWAPREPRQGPAEHLRMGKRAGWMLANPELKGLFGGLVFRFRASATYGDFLEVRLDSEGADTFPRVEVAPRHRKDLEGGWTEVFIPMPELNPARSGFQRVVLRARVELPPPGLVEIDHVGLTAASPGQLAGIEAWLTDPATPVVMSVDCAAAPKPISPLIYGIGFSPAEEYVTDHQWKVEPPARRWGGVAASRFNWELGSVWNTGAEHFFENVDLVRRKDFTWVTFLEVNRDRQVQTALTVPMIGWVAKDTRSASFPVDEFGPQQQVDAPRGAGNGVAKDGSLLRAGNPTRTSVVAPPDFIGRWVTRIMALQKERGRVVSQYILDHEPGEWSEVHRDVHPTPLTYDELVDRTIRYGTAIRKADPEAQIAGPAQRGVNGYLYSAVDLQAGVEARPDRRAHGDLPLVEWYLRRLAEHEKKTGVKVLDVFDLHFFPAGRSIGLGTAGQTDRETSALRIRATRSLWDPRYIDDSPVKEPLALIPRMRAWVDAYYPGLKLSIGAWNFGAEKHISGGLAVAEALGRFGQQGLHSAFYWTYPPEGSPAFQAFRAYRNYDGRGAAFQPLSLPAEAPRDTSIFASRSPDGRTVTLVLLNFSPADGFDAAVNLKGCANAQSQRVFTYFADQDGYHQQRRPGNRAYRLPPSSMTVVELKMPTP